MNALKKFGCRVYQKVMWVALWFLPWRKPELLQFDNGVEGLPAYIEKMGLKKVLLVSDEFFKNQGFCDKLVNAFKESKVECVWYYKAVPNPTTDCVEEGYKMYKENACEGIVAFGGGSPMDCAKGIGARAARPNTPISKMKGLMKVMHKLPPLFAIPTTAGTGSEATVAAVISDPRTHEKYPINDPNLIPRFAILDPKQTENLPPHMTSTTGVDALTHAVEAYIGSANTAETKKMAKEATKLIFENLEEAYKNPHNLQARDAMQKAAFYAGIAFTRAYVGNVHAMAHTLGGMYGVPHGLANAIILPMMLDEYGSTAWKKLAQLADVAGINGKDDEEKAKNFIQAIKDMNERMNIPTQIGVPGKSDKWAIKDEDIHLMSQRAEHEANPLYPCPKLFTVEEFEALFKKLQYKA